MQQNLDVSSRTRSQVALAISQDEISESTYENNQQLMWRATRKEIANAVLNPETGQMMEYHHLMKHRTLNMQAIWTTSAANELGRLFQGVGSNTNGGQRIKGTNTFFFIPKNKVPNKKIQDITYARIVCTIRDMKEDKHRTRITVGGNNIKHAGDVGTPTAHLETAKMLFNSVLSRKMLNLCL